MSNHNLATRGKLFPRALSFLFDFQQCSNGKYGLRLIQEIDPPPGYIYGLLNNPLAVLIFGSRLARVHLKEIFQILENEKSSRQIGFFSSFFQFWLVPLSLSLFLSMHAVVATAAVAPAAVAAAAVAAAAVAAVAAATNGLFYTP